ncbi:hypothetical protein [Subtercola boreus]|uniref:hypothetical protein n=1 Tax=Subtercola boreus TaxID=120213 RepID=UPI0011708CBC|nr:hypothetical protein [Subtercola boreus]TQL55038.1 hypothetical protein FB464_2593 [Subtercola boreus]
MSNIYPGSSSYKPGSNGSSMAAAAKKMQQAQAERAAKKEAERSAREKANKFHRKSW